MNKILVKPQISISNNEDSNNNYIIDLNFNNFELTIEENTNCTLLFCGSNLNQQIKVSIKRNAFVKIESLLSNINMNITIDLLEEGASLEFIYSELSNKKSTLNIDINHLAPHTSSNLYNHIVQYGNNLSKIKVNAKVKKGIKGCTLKQDNQIIITNNGKGEILPNLLIDEYDCFAQHSAYISKFSKDELFYLMSRGISYDDALILLIKSFLLGKITATDNMLEKFNSMIMDMKGGIYHES